MLIDDGNGWLLIARLMLVVDAYLLSRFGRKWREERGESD
jgi:hypothetical protein